MIEAIEGRNPAKMSPTKNVVGGCLMKFHSDSETRYSLISEDGHFRMRSESRDAGENKVFFEFAWERDIKFLAIVHANMVQTYGIGPRTIDVAIDMAELKRSATRDKYDDGRKRTISAEDLCELGDVIAQALAEFYRLRHASTAKAGLSVDVVLKYDGCEVRKYRNGQLLGGQ